MLMQQVGVLIPSFFTHLILSVFFAFTLGYVLHQFGHLTDFKWKAWVAVGSVVSLWYSSTTITQMYQNNLLLAHQQRQAQQQQQATASDPAKMKAELLGNIDTIAKDPSLATPENKQKLYGAYAAILQGPGRDEYKANVMNLLLCQRAFFQDAVASVEQKKATKQQDRATCETLPGVFFQREKLIPPELVARNNETIESLVEAKRSPASAKKKDGMPSLDDLKKALQAQEMSIRAVGYLFE